MIFTIIIFILSNLLTLHKINPEYANSAIKLCFSTPNK